MGTIGIDVFNQPEIPDACEEFRVKALYAFGSILEKPLTDVEDIDLLVVFERDGFSGAFDQFMGFKLKMEAVLGRPVDLISFKPFRNQVFQAEIDRTKKTIYAV